MRIILRILPVLMLTLFAGFARANLLSRMQLEDAYKVKIEKYVQMWDKKAQVLVRFEYKKISSNLPGTNLSGNEELPANIDLANIQSAMVQVFSARKDLPKDLESNIRKIIPIAPQAINVDIQAFTSDMDLKEVENLKKEDLKEISLLSIESLIEKMFLLFGMMFGGMVLVFGFFHFRKVREFKVQMNAINETLLSNQATPATALPIPEMAQQKLLTGGQGPRSGLDESLYVGNIHAFSYDQLMAILSDCYWCHHDAEAAWIWRRLKLEAKTELIKKWPPLKNYSRFLQNIEEAPTSLFEDIFYLSPPDIKHLDNEALAKILESNPSVWNQLSHLRHKCIQLSLELSLQVRAEGHATTDYEFSAEPASQVRNFELSSMISDLTLEEELKIENNPTIVPDHLRKKVPSLCWLALKDAEYIKNILNQFDARSLASAWVGPEKTLTTLESHLSDKKLKALKAYLETTRPSRNSPVFLQLHQFGVHDEAA